MQSLYHKSWWSNKAESNWSWQWFAWAYSVRAQLQRIKLWTSGMSRPHSFSRSASGVRKGAQSGPTALYQHSGTAADTGFLSNLVVALVASPLIRYCVHTQGNVLDITGPWTRWLRSKVSILVCLLCVSSHNMHSLTCLLTADV